MHSTSQLTFLFFVFSQLVSAAGRGTTSDTGIAGWGADIVLVRGPRAEEREEEHDDGLFGKPTPTKSVWGSVTSLNGNDVSSTPKPTAAKVSAWGSKANPRVDSLLGDGGSGSGTPRPTQAMLRKQMYQQQQQQRMRWMK